MKAKKQIYQNPQIELVRLDNEISLSLNSAPPEGPEEGAYLIPEYFNNEPCQTIMG